MGTKGIVINECAWVQLSCSSGLLQKGSTPEVNGTHPQQEIGISNLVTSKTTTMLLLQYGKDIVAWCCWNFSKHIGLSNVVYHLHSIEPFTKPAAGWYGVWKTTDSKSGRVFA